MYTKKALIACVLVCLVLSTVSPVYALNNDEEIYIRGEKLSDKIVCFLNKYSVDLTTIDNIDDISIEQEDGNSIANSYNESIGSLIYEASAYNFTEEQIKQYVDGLISTPTTVVSYSEPGIVTRADNRPNDDGIGYEVKSKSGYYQETAYATLPTVYRAASSGTYSDAYMFYTVSASNESWGIDVGLAYNSGNLTEGWRGCYTAAGSQTICGNLISSLSSGSLVYLNAKIESNGYLRFRVIDGNNFSTVYYDISYYVGDKGIYTTNGVFNRQITLCNGDKNFNTGAYAHNAQFNNAYIYSSSGYSRTIASNTLSNRRGAFGTNSTTCLQVTVNNYTPWYYENVSIDF